MRIELAESSSRPEPQFVVIAETEQDFLFMRSFLTAPDYSSDQLEFVKHGHTYENGKYRSFNLGWSKRKTKVELELPKDQRLVDEVVNELEEYKHNDEAHKEGYSMEIIIKVLKYYNLIG